MRQNLTAIQFINSGGELVDSYAIPSPDALLSAGIKPKRGNPFIRPSQARVE